MSKVVWQRSVAEVLKMYQAGRLVGLSAVVACLFTGCAHSGRPEVAPVSGVVALDGAPLANATVVFTPHDPGMKPSRGITDATGRYELTYLRDIKGAVLGTHEVRITTRTEHRPIERIPAKYNSRSELTAEVNDGENQINFDLKSE